MGEALQQSLDINDGILADNSSKINWRDVLGEERRKSYFTELLQFIEAERTSGKKIYPRNDEVFKALTLTPFNKVKVVILGQDPYHGPGQAHGLCFSVRPGIPLPPSLQNIYKELQSDLGITPSLNGSLMKWAKQGVLLLNSVLTVEGGIAASHANRGWEVFTDCIVKELNYRRSGLVFMLWGAYASKKGSIIDRSRHVVLEAPHPSPLSAHRGFLGCKHFSKANQALTAAGVDQIDWNVD